MLIEMKHQDLLQCDPTARIIIKCGGHYEDVEILNNS